MAKKPYKPARESELMARGVRFIIGTLLLCLLAFLAGFLNGCAKPIRITKVEAVPTPVPTVAATVVPMPTALEQAKEDRDHIKRTRPKFHHTVVKGDTLWAISGSKAYYGDPFLWPAIYKANRDQLADPHLIEVGQELEFPKWLTLSETRTAQRRAYAEPERSK